MQLNYTCHQCKKQLVFNELHGTTHPLVPLHAFCSIECLEKTHKETLKSIDATI